MPLINNLGLAKKKALYLFYKQAKFETLILDLFDKKAKPKPKKKKNLLMNRLVSTRVQ